MTIKVQVIGTSTFFGVPDGLLPLKDGKFDCQVDECQTEHDQQYKTLKLTPEQDRGTAMERLIECAGRTCYDSYGRGRNSSDYHKHILESGHGSVLEHAFISFFISGISRGCSHELVRHRAGVAISQRSTRFVDESESEWALHPLLEKELESVVADSPLEDVIITEDLEDSINEGVNKAKAIYRDIVTYLQGRGVPRKQARGAARGLLGNALSTELIWSANVRAIRNFLEQRANEGADAEIRLLANAIYKEAQVHCPSYFSDYEETPCSDGIGFSLATPYRKV